MARRAPIDEVERSVDTPDWMREGRSEAAAGLRSARRGSAETRHEALLRAAMGFAQWALADLARGLLSGRGREEALLRWARAAVADAELTIIELDPIEPAYVLGIRELLDTPRELEDAPRRLASLVVGRPDETAADVLVFLPAGAWPRVRRAAKPHRDVAELATAIRSKRASAIQAAAKRLVQRYERGESNDLGFPPFAWVPLPLLLARRACLQAGLAWVEPKGRSWAMWRDLGTARASKDVPGARAFFRLVDASRHSNRKRRARYHDPRARKAADLDAEEVFLDVVEKLVTSGVLEKLADAVRPRKSRSRRATTSKAKPRR